MTPYYRDETVTLWHGHVREVLPRLARPGGPVADVCVTDPPYGETAHHWDRWPDGWPGLVASALPAVTSMWCWGSLRMFLRRAHDFDDWRLGQELVWEKANGTGFAPGRLLRVHELAVQWYRGPWASVHHAELREPVSGPDKSVRRRGSGDHRNADSPTAYRDDGTRLARSVVKAASPRDGQHPTAKPASVLARLVEQSCPPGGTILDPFAGAGGTALVARALGRRAVLIEADETYCRRAAASFAQTDLLSLARDT